MVLSGGISAVGGTGSVYTFYGPKAGPGGWLLGLGLLLCRATGKTLSLSLSLSFCHGRLVEAANARGEEIRRLDQEFPNRRPVPRQATGKGPDLGCMALSDFADCRASLQGCEDGLNRSVEYCIALCQSYTCPRQPQGRRSAGIGIQNQKRQKSPEIRKPHIGMQPLSPKCEHVARGP